MKYLFTILVASLAFFSCSSDSSSTNGGDTAGTEAAAPAANANKVWHYTCPSNCANSGADGAGACSVCGTQLAHNQAWHNLPENQPQAQPATPQSDQISPIITTPPAAEATPAQNAAGVWHYTCANGCSGGGGAEGPCPSCGAALVHNSAYHQ